MWMPASTGDARLKFLSPGQKCVKARDGRDSKLSTYKQIKIDEIISVYRVSPRQTSKYLTKLAKAKRLYPCASLARSKDGRALPGDLSLLLLCNNRREM